MSWLQSDKAFAEKIQTALKGQCTKSTSKIREELECNANALEEASIKNGLTNQWKTFQPQIEKHLNVSEQCSYPLYVTTKATLICTLSIIYWKSTISLFFGLFSCIMKEISFVLSLSIQYVEAVAEEPNFPKFFEDSQKITNDCIQSKQLNVRIVRDDWVKKNWRFGRSIPTLEKHGIAAITHQIFQWGM